MLVAASFLSACPRLAAGFTYVDATSGAGGNTTLANGSAFSPPLNGTNGSDNNWEQRTTYASGGNVFESGGEGAENAPEIRTRIGGLTPGASYRVHVHFWDAAPAWRIRAGFQSNPGSNTLYANTAEAAGIGATGAVAASALSYSVPPGIFVEADRTMFAAPLGIAIADAGGGVDVFMDDMSPVSGANDRAWYDGVSYEPVVTDNPVTYVDAGTANTNRWDGNVFAPAAEGVTGLDHNWETRALGNSGNVLESNGEPGILEDAPMLVTSLTGLVPDTEYALYAYFWSDGSNWRLKATTDPADIQNNGTPGDLTDDSLPGSPATGFAAANNASGTATVGVNASATTFAANPLFTEANRTLKQASLGTATSDATGKIAVYIDDFAFGNQPNRTWYDGAGYKLALPLDPDQDEDLDSLTNGAEENTHGTDPYLTDTDGDSYGDSTEIAANSNPLDPNSVPPPPGNGVEISPDGAWTWFNDERAIIHQGSLFSGYVRGNGTYGITRRDLATGQNFHSTISTAASQQVDDHNNPSITVLPDGKLTVLYSKHAAGSVFWQRTSNVALPSSDADWGAEITRSVPASNTYANTYRLSSEANSLYNFHRCINFNPTLTISTDNGATWGASRQLIGTGGGSTRPYPRYTSNGSDRIDAIYTDGHPRDVNNSVYHMFYRNGGLHKTDGTLIDSLANIPLDHDGGKRGSVIYQYSAAAWESGQGPDDWIPTGRGWTWDVHYGANGNPVCVFQVQRDGAAWSEDRIYYYYARWTGTSWQRKFIAQAGRPLYSAEDDYGGGMCLDPDDPRVVYLSSNAANPFSVGDIDNVPLAANSRYEIHRGFTRDGGLTFTWTPVTLNSTTDNLRPIVPMHHGRSGFLLWFNGTYTTYTGFSTRVLARIGSPLTSYASWAGGHSIPSTMPLDSDGDGLDNLLEFAFAGDPASATSRPLPQWSDNSFVFPWPENLAGVEWQVQESGDLVSWNTVAVLRGGDLPNDTGSAYQMTTEPGRVARFTPVGTSARRFLRVLVKTE
jgi:hypothetical protein